jgi:hypothetical protein
VDVRNKTKDDAALAERRVIYMAELKSPLCRGFGGTLGTVFSTSSICLSVSFAFLSRSRASSSSSLRQRVRERGQTSVAGASSGTPARHISTAVVIEEHVNRGVIIAALVIVVILLQRRLNN